MYCETAIGFVSQNCNTYEQQNNALNSTQEHLHIIYIEQHCVGTLHANFGRNMTNILSKLCAVSYNIIMHRSPSPLHMSLNGRNSSILQPIIIQFMISFL